MRNAIKNRLWIARSGAGLCAVALAALVAAAASASLAEQPASSKPGDTSAEKSPDGASNGGANGKAANARPARRSSAMPAFTPEREAAAMTFVRQHHAEVADLLERLKANQPMQYRRAAAQLFRASERIAQWKDRDPERYELELRLWKANSRIQLLSARLTTAPADELDAQLKSAIAERIDARIAIRKHEREQFARRVSEAERDISRLTAERDAQVNQQFTEMRGSIDKNRRNRPKANRAKSENLKDAPADKPANNQSDLK
jgi:hypothetical protein